MGCMSISARDLDDPLVHNAIHWLAQFYSDLDVSCHGDKFILRADHRSDTELGILWRSALANERLYDAARSTRASALATLA